MTQTIGLFYSPWSTEAFLRPRRFLPLAQYRYAVWYKSNPRSADYMQALLRERHPDATWVDARSGTEWQAPVARADRIVLLYPDAIGLGFGGLEREVAFRRRTWATIEALNGRRRQFRLNGATRLGLRLRRAIEWSMLGEFLFLPIFAVVTPVLMAVDALRGRR